MNWTKLLNVKSLAYATESAWEAALYRFLLGTSQGHLFGVEQLSDLCLAKPCKRSLFLHVFTTEPCKSRIQGLPLRAFGGEIRVHSSMKTSVPTLRPLLVETEGVAVPPSLRIGR